MNRTAADWPSVKRLAIWERRMHNAYKLLKGQGYSVTWMNRSVSPTNEWVRDWEGDKFYLSETSGHYDLQAVYCKGRVIYVEVKSSNGDHCRGQLSSAQRQYLRKRVLEGHKVCLVPVSGHGWSLGKEPTCEVGPLELEDFQSANDASHKN
jgi:hypothetical protein